MHIVSYTEAKNKLKDIMDSTWDDYEPVVISQKNGKHVVVMSIEDFETLDETAHLSSMKATNKA